MNALIAIILALTVKNDLLVDPAVLYQGHGDILPNKQLISSFYAKKNIPITLEAKGEGRGDIDCYLLMQNDSGEGWVIANKDESNLDQCSITYTSTLAQPMRAWVVNHGVHTTNYTMIVKQ